MGKNLLYFFISCVRFYNTKIILLYVFEEDSPQEKV